MRSRSHSWNSASLALVLNLGLSSTAALAGDVANQVSSPVPSTIHSFWPSAVCNSAALGCLGPVLVYDNNSTHQLATRALDWCGIPYTKAVAADFVTLLGGGGWDVVLMDLPSSEPSDTAWPDALASHITAGGKAIHTHWNSGSLTPALQAAYEITAGPSHATLTFYEWAGPHSLFSSPNLISGTFDVWVDVWAANGFQIGAVGSAIEAAGFTSSPAAGQAAIVIGNSGRTVFNGFLFDDFEPADKDADLDPDMIELIVNELASFCAGPSSCGDRIRDPGEDCDEGGVDTATCDSDCTFPVCGDRHRNLPAGEACDGGGVDTASCDADCTPPACGDLHPNAPAGEACDEGGVDTATCDADCTLPSCGDSYRNAAAGEACDEGGIDTATCDADCTLPSCGDSYHNAAAGEACDEGGVDTATCDADCTLPSCGDSYRNAAAGEMCDEGGIDTVACDSDCTLPVCGDGHWNVPAGEGCDDGGTTPGDGCSATCQVEACLVGSLTPLTLLKGVREGVGARFSWAPPTMPAVAHVNQVVARSAIPMAWRSPRGPGTPACDAVAGILECLDPTPPPDAPATGFLQVVAACGSSGLDEGPI